MLQGVLPLILNEFLKQHNMANCLEDNATVHGVLLLIYQLFFDEELVPKL